MGLVDIRLHRGSLTKEKEMVTARLLEDGLILKEQEFEDAQDALKWLWDEAEKTDHDKGKLSGTIDNNEVTF